MTSATLMTADAEGAVRRRPVVLRAARDNSQFFGNVAQGDCLIVDDHRILRGNDTPHLIRDRIIDTAVEIICVRECENWLLGR